MSRPEASPRPLAVTPVSGPLAAEDLHQCLRVLRSAFGGVANRMGFTEQSQPRHPAFWGPDRWDRAISEDGTLLVARDPVIRGCVFVCPVDDSSGVWSLRRLAVDPVLQGSGIGSALVSAAVARARTGGASAITLHIVEGHHALASWYRRRGFHHVGRSDPPGLGFGIEELRLPLRDG